MKGFLRLFPLNWVIFPNEQINLHIFEPRYKQLIGEVEESGDHFGIPFFNSGLKPFGTVVRLKEIRKKYPDGKMDISVVGLEPFDLLNFIPQVESKLYPAGNIKTRTVSFENDPFETAQLLLLLDEFFEFVGMRPKNLELSPGQLSFSVGHKIGLDLSKELELLLLPDESSRQVFLIEHLELVISTLKQVNVAKKRIQLNGHFRNFDPIDFK